MTEALASRRPPDAEPDEVLLPPDIRPGLVDRDRVGREIRLGGSTMGTDWTLTAYVAPSLEEGPVTSAVEGAFDRIIGQMSQWEPASKLSRFNHAAPGTSFNLPREFAYVLDCALQIARATGGAFDPAIGRASEMWGFGANAAPSSPPGEQNLADARRYDWRDVRLAADGRTLMQPGGLHLDFSGIAKGFAVDLALHQLRDLGIADALLEIGGEFRGVGLRADGLPWWVDIERPPLGSAPSARVGLTGWAIATSGNYRRRRGAPGKSWPHTIAPRTSMPVDDILSVSVLHRQCMQADALATALIVLGPQAGRAFADENAIPMRMVLPHETVVSAAWRRWLN